MPCRHPFSNITAETPCFVIVRTDRPCLARIVESKVHQPYAKARIGSNHKPTTSLAKLTYRPVQIVAGYIAELLANHCRILVTGLKVPLSVPKGLSKRPKPIYLAVLKARLHTILFCSFPPSEAEFHIVLRSVSSASK